MREHAYFQIQTQLFRRFYREKVNISFGSGRNDGRLSVRMQCRTKGKHQ